MKKKQFKVLFVSKGMSGREVSGRLQV